MDLSSDSNEENTFTFAAKSVQIISVQPGTRCISTRSGGDSEDSFDADPQCDETRDSAAFVDSKQNHPWTHQQDDNNLNRLCWEATRCEEASLSGEVENQADRSSDMTEGFGTSLLSSQQTEASLWVVSSDICAINIAGSVLELPRSVYDRLYGYQRQGVTWMWGLYTKQFGGILADEMGLGKTVQVAALFACLKYAQQASRFLVVVPVTLIEQWRRELNSWAGDYELGIHALLGTAQERRAALRQFAQVGGVLLTSYDLLRSNIAALRWANAAYSVPDMQQPRKRKHLQLRDDDDPSEGDVNMFVPAPGSVNNIPWDVIVLDEAHRVKNPTCEAARELRKVRSRSQFLLTGTPLQNKLVDLWALMDLAQPSLLGNYATFEKAFSDPIARGSQKNASTFEIELKDHLARELKRLTAPHFLRRLKSDISSMCRLDVPDSHTPSEIPPKTDVVLWLNPTRPQLQLYEKFLGSELVRRVQGQGRCGMEALRAIGVLKKLCNHPLLCLPALEYEKWHSRTLAFSFADKVVDVDDDPPGDCEENILSRLRGLLPGSIEGAVSLSCKLRVLGALLPQLQRKGHRCLIFSHSTRMLDLIQSCVLRVLGLKFLRIDGTVDPKDRDVKIQKFQSPDSPYFCICLSAQVGGVGLTITDADRVILVDPAWNPAMDAQAIDRVHRIGQRRKVVVYRLIVSGAIEDKMFRVQVYKRGLAKTAFEHEQQVRFFSNKDLKQLFESPRQSSSTQELMAEKLGIDALEHEDLLSCVAADIGGAEDTQAMAFWQSTDVVGFSDYEKLFMYLEQVASVEVQAEGTARVLTEKLLNEEYQKDQMVKGKLLKTDCDIDIKENAYPCELASL